MIVLNTNPIINSFRVAFAPVGRLLACSEYYKGLVVWDDVTDGRPPREVPGGFTHSYQTPQFSPDGSRVMCCDAPGAVVYDLAAGSSFVVPPFFAGNWCRAALTPAGDEIVTCEMIPAAGTVPADCQSAGHRIALRSLSDPRPEASRWVVDTPDFVDIAPLFLRDRPEVVTVQKKLGPKHNRMFQWWAESWWQRLVVRDATTGQVLREHRESERISTSLAVAPGGQTVVGLTIRQIAVWDLGQPHRPPRIVQTRARRDFGSLAFHPTGKYLAVGNGEKVVRIFDTGTWEMVRIYSCRDVGAVGPVAFSADGLLLAGSGCGKIAVWDVDL